MSLGIALVGAGRIGTNHAAIVARQVPGARLVALADPVEIAAKRLAAELDADAVDVETLLDRSDVDGVLITAPARSHTDLVVAAAAAGRIGTPQLLRSLTRDPGPFTADPARIPQWTIFFETLIHDFYTLCFPNPGARPVAVHAFADALVAP